MVHVGRGENLSRLAVFDALAQQARCAECQRHLVSTLGFEIARHLGQRLAQAACRKQLHARGLRPSCRTHCGTHGQQGMATMHHFAAFGKNNCLPPIL